MLDTNEFKFHLNPLKPNIMVLEMTKKSKRNLRIKQFAPLAISLVFTGLVCLVPESVWDRTLNDPVNEETPDED